MYYRDFPKKYLNEILDSLKTYLEGSMEYTSQRREDPAIKDTTWMPSKEKEALQKLIHKIRNDGYDFTILVGDMGAGVFLIQNGKGLGIDLTSSEKWSPEERLFLKKYAVEMFLLKKVLRTKEDLMKEYEENIEKLSSLEYELFKFPFDLNRMERSYSIEVSIEDGHKIENLEDKKVYNLISHIRALAGLATGTHKPMSLHGRNFKELYERYEKIIERYSSCLKEKDE